MGETPYCTGSNTRPTSLQLIQCACEESEYTLGACLVCGHWFSVYPHGRIGRHRNHGCVEAVHRGRCSAQGTDARFCQQCTVAQEHIVSEDMRPRDIAFWPPQDTLPAPTKATVVPSILRYCSDCGTRLRANRTQSGIFKGSGAAYEGTCSACGRKHAFIE